jgi:hypothetical protein
LWLIDDSWVYGFHVVNLGYPPTTIWTTMTSDHTSENLTDYWLEPADLARLLETQNECTFMWTNRAGQPFGVVMSYFSGTAPDTLGVPTDESLWLTCAAARARVPAVRRTGYAAITVTGRGSEVGSGRTASFRGPCHVHDDRAIRDWMLPRLAHHLRPDSVDGAHAMLAHLDTPNRVVLQLIPEFRLDFDSTKMWVTAQDAAPPGRLD